MKFTFTTICFSWIMRLFYAAQSFMGFLLGGDACIRCGSHVSAMPVCKTCRKLLFAEEHSPRCRICGKQLLGEISVCISCRENLLLKSVDGVFPLYSYRLWKKPLLFSWKMEEKRILSPFFAELIAKKIFELYKLFGREIPVVPVPPRPGKIRKNGWDQISDICFYLKHRWQIKILPLLERKSVVQQKKLGRADRLSTIGQSYAMRSDSQIEKLASKMPDTLIIIDDVLTTGSTVETCAEILKSNGAGRVFAITLFIVD